jgi:hypothetical protein
LLFAPSFQRIRALNLKNFSHFPDSKFVILKVSIRVKFNALRCNSRNLQFGAIVFFLLVHMNTKAQRFEYDRQHVSPHLKEGMNVRSLVVMVKDSANFAQWLSENVPGAKLDLFAPYKTIYKISGLSSLELQRILKAPSLEFAETTQRRPHPERELSGIDLSLNSVTTVHGRYPTLTGEGLIVSLKENPFDKEDIDYLGRIYDVNEIPDSADVHATSMATIIAGAANSSPEGKGVAGKVSISSSDFENLLPDNTDDLLHSGISVQNHSYGVGIENYYGIESNQYDKQCLLYPSLVHVFSAGNSGDKTSTDGTYAGIDAFANLTGQFKMSKNTLSVGGTGPSGIVETLSSRGPGYDGRVKPDLVAYGNGGTSEAAAIVSGISLLIQQAYKDQVGSLPPSSLVRAALINSAEDSGRPNVDYEYGYGQANSSSAVTSITDKTYFNSAVTQDEVKMFDVVVPQNTYRLKVTLVWNDREANPGVTKALVNDLDMSLLQLSSGKVFKPWVLSSFPHADSLKKVARRSADHLNTVEQITIDYPLQGSYSLAVAGFSLTQDMQDFSVVYEIQPEGFEWVFPITDDPLLANASSFIRWHWSGEDASAVVEWKKEGSVQWSVIGSANLSQGYLTWNVPDINDIVQVRVRSDGRDFSSDTFVVSRKINLKVDFNCETDALLSWRNTNENQYQVFKLDDLFLESKEVTSDTTLMIDKNMESSQYFAVAPLVSGRRGVRSRTINYTRGQDCYVKSFLPRELVTDSVLLDLVLGTNIGISSITLERESSNGFISIQTIDPTQTNAYVFYDPQPLPGNNEYRVRITRSKQIIYSEIEEVIFARDNDLMIYPNPVSQGNPFYVIVNSESATFSIYDLKGQLLHQATDEGEVKTIDAALPAGMYLVKTRTASGKILIGKVSIK